MQGWESEWGGVGGASIRPRGGSVVGGWVGGRVDGWVGGWMGGWVGGIP